MAQQVDILFNARMNVDNAMKGIKEIQQTLGKIQMPKGLESSFEKSFGNLDGLIKKFNDQLNKGVKTKGDVTGLERLTKQIDSELTKIGLDFKKLTGQEVKFKFDTKEVKQAREEFTKLIEERNKFAASQANQKLRGSGGKSANSLLDDVAAAAGNNKTKTGQAAIAAKAALNAGDIDEYNKQLAIVERYFGRIKEGAAKLGIEPEKAFKLLRGAVTDSTTEMEKYNAAVEKAKGKYDLTTAKAVEEAGRQAALAAQNFEKQAGSIKKVEEEQKQLANQSQSLNQNISQLESHVAMYFSFAAILRKVTQVARKAFQTVKELDKAMVETAVVTHFDVSDMWDMLPTYTKNANELGSTIKDVYEAATLYYQQGLNTTQAMGLANETLKMARIGGLQAAEATDMMTAALRGFNMQINEMSAQRINDVYSKLAAITASDTRELGSAMERTASIANSAGMAFETTSAFLAQMIETTREAPENLGTAMKTIVARFQEMKNDPTKLIDAEGEMLDANRVDKALKTIGVNLMDTNGQFRQLDDVFLEISQKWDGLSQAQQRYIATIAAGSRQQSRFIAMVQNYDRVMELTQAANNATGASQEQFNKTLEGLDAKLNKLKNAWDQFAMGLANNKIIKVAVDGMTSFFTIINKILGVFDHFPDPFGGLTKSIVTLLAVVKGMNFAGTILTGGVRGLGGWARGDAEYAAPTPLGGMKKGVDKQFEETRTAKQNAAIKRQAAIDANTYKANAIRGLQGFNFGELVTLSRQASKNGAASLINKIYPPGEISAASRKVAFQIANEIQTSVQKGIYSKQSALAALKSRLSGAGFNVSGIDTTSRELQNIVGLANRGQSAFQNFGKGVTAAGGSLQTLSMLLSTTPLAPFTGILLSASMIMQSLGTTIGALYKKVLLSTVAYALETKAIKANTAALYQNKIANGTLTSKQAGALIGRVNGFGGVLKGIGSNILKFFTSTAGKVTLIAAGIAVATALVYRAATKSSRELAKAGKAAGEAADAYASTTQSLSELRDNLDKIREADAGFDGLVEGTAAFNEQLVKSNELILQLLNKYPMLYDYLSTDSSGRMKISDEGMEEVLKYQQQITSQAAALNSIKNGEYQALKTEQEEKQVRKDRREEIFSSDVDKERLEYYDKELENLQRQQDTYRQTSKLTAISTKLSGKELANQEAISQLYADQYDTRKAGVKLSKKEAYQAYADFYDYRYEGGKLLDQEGNKVDIKKKEVMDAAEDITVLADIELDADSLNKTISDANKIFSKNFDFGDNKQGASTFISDLLSKNFEANEDAIIKVLKDDSSLKETAAQLSAEQVASILGVSVNEVEENLEKYQQQVVTLLKDNAAAIAKTQGQNYSDLGIMLGKSRGTTNTKAITSELQKMSQAQRQSILQAGQALEKSAGEESMKAMVAGMTDIYEGTNLAEKTNLDKLLDGVNWDSAIERYAAFNRLTEEGIGKVRDLGNEMLNLEESSDLVAEAFEEAYDSADFQEAIKDLSDMADEAGHLDASDIKELSKESSTLNKLLDSGIISTGGMARAMNLLHDNGDMTLMDLNSDLLMFLDTLGQVDTAIGDAHNLIENFDPGIDTGESEDFIIDSVKKYNELFEAGEWGNPQMRAYAELIVGAQAFNDALRDNNGNLKETYKQFNDIINQFSNGAYGAWSKLANSTSKAASIFSWGQNGEIRIDLSNIKSIEDLTNVLEENGYSKEAAQIMIEEYINYSPDFQKAMEAIAFTEAFNKNSGEMIKNRLSAKGDKSIFLQSELEKFAIASGADPKNQKEIKEKTKEIADKISESSGVPVSVVDDTKKDMTLEEKGQLLSQEYTGKKNAGAYDLLTKNDKVESDKYKGALDVGKMIKIAQQYGMTETEAREYAFGAAQNTNKDVYYDDEKLDKKEIDTLGEWDEWLSQIFDSEKWEKVGQDIAAGWFSYLADHDTNGDGVINDKDVQTTTTPDDNGNGNGGGYTASSVEDKYGYRGGRAFGETPDYTNLQGDWLADNYDYNTEGYRKGFDSGIEFDTKAVDDYFTAIGEATTATEEYTAVTKEANAEADPEKKPKVVPDTPDSKAEANKYFQEYRKNAQQEFDKHPVTLTFTEDQRNEAVINHANKLLEDQEKDVNKHFNETLGNIRTQTFQWIDEFGKKHTVEVNVDAKTEQALAKAKTVEDYVNAMRPAMVVDGQTASAQQRFNILFNNNNGRVLTWILNIKKVVTEVLGKGKSKEKNNDSKNSGNEEPTIKIDGGDTSVGSYGDYTGPGGGNNSGGGGGGGGNNTKPTINNFSIQEIIRYDAEKRLASYQSSLDKLEKTLEKNLEKIGVTTSDISKNINKQRSYLNKEIKDQNKITGTYNKQLKKLDKGGYYEYLSWTDSTGQSHDGSKYNLSNYIKKNKRGVYQVDTNAINATAAKVGKSNANDRRAVREMLYKAAQGALDPLVSGLEDSKKKTQEYKERLKELDKQVYEAFYAWENELTRIYNINQKIEQVTKRIERVGSYVDLELARVGAGAMGTTKAINNSVQALKRENSSRKTQINLQKQLINGEQERLMTALSDEDERAELKRAQKEGNTARIQAAKDAVTAANLADKYTVVTLNNDSTADINVNWEKLEKDRRSGKITEKTYQAIKERIEEMISANADLEDAIKGLNDAYAELYNELIEYRQTIEDMEDTLLKQLEAETKKRIDNAKKLSTAITKALKDILDTVRKRLQERRQKEDNAKTEQDIANKQQRLNLLRANTSGGNKTEIAQLEKEIADAQQSYGRTLEDQLLQKLQDQADEAAKQRERQIQIAEDQLEIQKDINKQIVYEYLLALRNTGTMPAEAMELLKAANNYDEKGIFGSKFSLDKLEQDVTKTGIALREIQASRTGSTAWTAEQAGNVIKGINEINKALGNNDSSTQALKSYNRKDTPAAARKLIEKAGSKSNVETIKAMSKAGYSHNEIRQANFSLKSQMAAGTISSAKGAKSAGYGLATVVNNGLVDSIKEAQAAGYNMTQVYRSRKFSWADIEKYYGKNADRILTDTRAKRVAGSIKNDKDHGGWGKTKTKQYENLKKVFGPNNASFIWAYVKNNDVLFTKGAYTYAKMAKRNWQKFATGGFADFTGPAWLDGTPSKPEAVLNAADTKNFVQLRDILSSLMKGGAFDGPAYAAAGDTNFEININVDHIANDYDVDRIADRVKKQIVESSQYRNVNQVRRLR